MASADADGEIQRFTGVQVYFHAVFASSIFVLLLTGLPITFHDRLWWLIAIIGYQNVVFVHVAGAVALVVSSLYYALFVATGIVTGGITLHALPDRSDVDEALQHVRYLVGRAEKPDADKYTFLQKSEIWILAFEVIVLTATGIFLWFRGLLVGQGRALLLLRDVHAVVALTMLMGIVFHLFVTHLSERSIDWTMATGTVSRDRAREEWADWVDAGTPETTAPDGGEHPSIPTEGEVSTRLTRATIVGLVVVIAAIYTGILLNSILSPLPSGASLLDWLQGDLPHGVLGWFWTVTLNLAVLLLLGGFAALLYGVSIRLRGETP